VLEEGQLKVRERAIGVTVGGLPKFPLGSFIYGWDFHILNNNPGGNRPHDILVFF
jgi:hypothetical protein